MTSPFRNRGGFSALLICQRLRCGIHSGQQAQTNLSVSLGPSTLRRMSRQNAGREELIRSDVEDLKRLGYAQQLFREMGGFANFAISFSIISVLTGAILLYG